MILQFVLVLLSLSSAVVQRTERLTEDQMKLILSIKGDWKIDETFAGEERWNEPMLTSVRFTKDGMILLNRDESQERVLWHYTSFDTAKSRVDVRLKREGKVHIYSLCKKKEKICLVTRIGGNSKPPVELEPKAGQLCLYLSKIKKKSSEEKASEVK